MVKKDKRTYADRRESNVRFVTQRRKKIKLMAIEYKGGKCQVCGYNRCVGALDFHHIKNEEKSFSISDYGHCRAWEKVKLELDKCLLLCANCHREIHDKDKVL